MSSRRYAVEALVLFIRSIADPMGIAIAEPAIALAPTRPSAAGQTGIKARDRLPIRFKNINSTAMTRRSMGRWYDSGVQIIRAFIAGERTTLDASAAIAGSGGVRRSKAGETLRADTAFKIKDISRAEGLAKISIIPHQAFVFATAMGQNARAFTGENDGKSIYSLVAANQNATKTENGRPLQSMVAALNAGDSNEVYGITEILNVGAEVSPNSIAVLGFISGEAADYATQFKNVALDITNTGFYVA